MKNTFTHDVLIIGSGAAGLSLALRLSSSIHIAVLSKVDLKESNTFYAQGGISAVLDDKDTFDSHIKDTLVAGVGICDEKTVEFVVEHGPENIGWLKHQGMEFTCREEKNEYHLTKEGGHSHRRVIHAADATGKEMEETLENSVRKLSHVDLYEYHVAIDLITNRQLGKEENQCLGAYVLNEKTHEVATMIAKVVVLATGGANKVYLYTSNPDITTGDGIAMGWRAGCRVANMEFIQFHPTCLYHPHAKSFLVTEALRGEGARLLLPDKTEFMKKFHPLGELAPRDIVARAIDHEMKRLGADFIYLDISHKPADFIRDHFPNIYKKCLTFGIDITQEPIPIVPAAHYTCGGLMVDHQARTDILGLYAIGEVSYTGLHGANRMASNSLLECLVFGESAAKDIERVLAEIQLPDNIPAWDESRVTISHEAVLVSHNWEELRRFMWDYVGIVRSNKRLARAKRRINMLKHEIREYYGNFRVTNDLLELRNLVDVADLIIRSAQRRCESRGLHYTLDFPQEDESQAEATILIPSNYQPSQRKHY